MTARGKADYYDLGNWNAVCYECGRKFKASELLRHWQGYYVCRTHYENRQPQDFVRAIPENVTPPWVQPPPEDTFIQHCTINGSSAIIGAAIVDCSIIDYYPPSFDPAQG